MNSFAYLLRQQIFFYDKSNNFFTFILFMLSSLDRYTKPQTFADCVGDELPLGWEESFDQIIGRYYINHFDREFHFTNHFFPSSYTNVMHSLSEQPSCIFIILIRINTIGRSASRMEIHSGANASRVPNISTGCACSQKGNL